MAQYIQIPQVEFWLANNTGGSVNRGKNKTRSVACMVELAPHSYREVMKFILPAHIKGMEFLIEAQRRFINKFPDGAAQALAYADVKRCRADARK